MLNGNTHNTYIFCVTFYLNLHDLLDTSLRFISIMFYPDRILGTRMVISLDLVLMIIAPSVLELRWGKPLSAELGRALFIKMIAELMSQLGLIER